MRFTVFFSWVRRQWQALTQALATLLKKPSVSSEVAIVPPSQSPVPLNAAQHRLLGPLIEATSAPSNWWLDGHTLDDYLKTIIRSKAHVISLHPNQVFWDFEVRLAKKNKYRKKLQAAELLLLPACFNRSQAEQLTLPPGVVGDDHWYLLALKRVSSEPVRFDITIVDGFNRCPSQNYHFLWQQALLLLKCLYGPNVKYTEVLQTLPQQSNVYDCGAVVGYCAQQMLNQDNVCLTLPQQIDYSAHRLVMAQTLAPEFKLPQLLSYSPQNLTSEPQTPSLTTSPRVTA